MHHDLRGRLHDAELRFGDATGNARRLDEPFARYPAIGGVLTSNSTCYMLTEYLAACPQPGGDRWAPT